MTGPWTEILLAIRHGETRSERDGGGYDWVDRPRPRRPPWLTDRVGRVAVLGGRRLGTKGRSHLPAQDRTGYQPAECHPGSTTCSTQDGPVAPEPIGDGASQSTAQGGARRGRARRRAGRRRVRLRRRPPAAGRRAGGGGGRIGLRHPPPPVPGAAPSTSYVVPSDEGPNRKYYAINESGRTLLQDETKIWRAFSDAVGRSPATGSRAGGVSRIEDDETPRPRPIWTPCGTSSDTCPRRSGATCSRIWPCTWPRSRSTTPTRAGPSGLVARLGPPATYAAELRRAAGCRPRPMPGRPHSSPSVGTDRRPGRIPGRLGWRGRPGTTPPGRATFAFLRQLGAGLVAAARLPGRGPGR